MSGIILKKLNKKEINKNNFEESFGLLGWRGCGLNQISYESNNKTVMGVHFNSLSKNEIITINGYSILFDGYITNKNRLLNNFNISSSFSVEEIVLSGYINYGKKFLQEVEGGFAFIIVNHKTDEWIAVRDSFGIKPLYYYLDENKAIISSEASVIANILNLEPCNEALEEWKVIRRPLPGYSFFKEIKEVLPGTCFSSNGEVEYYWNWKAQNKEFEQSIFQELLFESIQENQTDEHKITSLLSGGLDSALIAKISDVTKCYTIGLPDNNEFEGAQDTATVINKALVKIEFNSKELQDNWKNLTNIKKEPLSLPNEGLIYQVCKSTDNEEKIILTGEGADELLFGYDGIFRWCLELSDNEFNPVKFLCKYGYAKEIKSKRLIDFVEALKKGKTPIEFLEDFFYQVHLPCLLRRMDVASTAAGKQARVPFVSKKLVAYLYRQPAHIKINSDESKLPIRKLAQDLKLSGALERKKIGFSATIDKSKNRQDDYEYFRNITLGELKW